MASTITKQQQQLRELLQQKQEPFVLDLYLFERGYHLKKSLSSKLESSRLLFGCCYNNANYSNNKPSCSRMLRAMLNKLSPSNKRRNTKTSSSCSSVSDRERSEAKSSANEMHRNSNGHEVSEREQFSWASSSTTVFDSPSTCDDKKYDHDSVIADTLEGLRLSNMTEEEDFAGRDFQCPFMANNKQLSPVSVLEPIPQSRHCFRTRQDHECQTTCTVRLPSKMVVQDSTTSTLSASLCQISFHSISDMSIKDYNDSMKFNTSHSPQFVLDCVTEIIVATRNETMKKCHNKGLFGNLVLERMETWDSKHIRNDQSNPNLTSLMDLETFNDSSQEWKNGLDIEKREISLEIGNSIAEEIVTEIIVESLNAEKILL